MYRKYAAVTGLNPKGKEVAASPTATSPAVVVIICSAVAPAASAPRFDMKAAAEEAASPKAFTTPAIPGIPDAVDAAAGPPKFTPYESTPDSSNASARPLPESDDEVKTDSSLSSLSSLFSSLFVSLSGPAKPTSLPPACIPIGASKFLPSSVLRYASNWSCICSAVRATMSPLRY